MSDLTTKKRMGTGMLSLLAVVSAVALGAPATAGAGLIKKVQLPAGKQSGTARWSYPSGFYVVGNYFNGWTFIAYGPAQGSFRWGWLGGDVQGCVWVYSGNLPAGGTQTSENRCGPPRKEPGPPFSFAPRQVWDNKDGDDGIDATLDPKKCGGKTYRYANARPWLAATRLIRPMGNTPLTKARRVKKRYLAQAGNDTILVRDPELGRTGGYPSNWFFVPAACVV